MHNIFALSADSLPRQNTQGGCLPYHAAAEHGQHQHDRTCTNNTDLAEPVCVTHLLGTELSLIDDIDAARQGFGIFFKFGRAPTENVRLLDRSCPVCYHSYRDSHQRIDDLGALAVLTDN